MRKVSIYMMILVFVVSMLFMAIGCKTTAVETTAAATTAAATTAAATTAAASTEIVSIELDFTPPNKIIPPAKFKPIAPEVGINMGMFGVWDLRLPHPAQDLGFFADVNINIIKFYDFSKENTMLETLQEGSTDIAGTSAIVSVPLGKTLDKIIWLGTFDYWWGNAVMARPGEFKTYAEILKEVGDAKEAARLACYQLKGKTFDAMLGAGHENFITAVLELGGLTMKDVKFNDMPNVEAAAAFIRGEGDVYVGDLPGRYRVAEEGAIPIIDASLFEQEAWCDVGFLTNKDWLKNNEDAALRFLGALYRVSDALSGPDKDIPLEIMRQNVNRMAGSNFTLEQGRVVNSQISPWFTVEQAREILYSPDNKFNWKDRLQYLIDWNISQGKLKEGDVTIESHSRSDELFEKYWNYKVQSEEDMKLAAEAYNSGTAKNSDEVRNLIEQAKWNWDIRNYIDAAKFAADAKSSAGI